MHKSFATRNSLVISNIYVFWLHKLKQPLMRKFFLYLAALLIISSCDNLKKKDTTSGDDEEVTTKIFEDWLFYS